MSEGEERYRGIPEGPGVLTGIRALRVEVKVVQLVAERLHWSDHRQAADPAPAASRMGTRGSFNPNMPEEQVEERTVKLRRAEDDGKLCTLIQEGIEKDLPTHHITASRTSPQVLRFLITTLREAGNSHQAVIVRLECLEPVRLARGTSDEYPVVIWTEESVRWQAVADLNGVLFPVVSLFVRFMDAFSAQNAEYVRRMDYGLSAEEPPDPPAPPR